MRPLRPLRANNPLRAGRPGRDPQDARGTTWLVAGLGNPGPAYAPTRHNVGFLTVDELARRLGTGFSMRRGVHAAVATGLLGQQRVALVKPQTFMNDSGLAVRRAVDFFRIDVGHLIVVHDELDLDFGRLRVKLGGGDNGHNGLKSIRTHLGTGDFYRVRIGIGRPPGRQEPADYVLAPIPPALRTEFAVQAGVAADAVEALIESGDLAGVQNRFNS